MDRYVYEARDKAGKIVQGMVEADSAEAAEDLLKYNQLFALSVKPYLTFDQKIIGTINSLIGGIRAKDKSIFARQLSTMINAGLPLMDALKYLARQTKNKDMKNVILKIIALIERGKSFSFALEQSPEVFSPIFISMVRSGEASGKLDKVLNDLAIQMESDYKMKSKLKGALIYPSFIVLAVFAVGVFALVYVIPKLEEVFTSSGMSLPITTLLLISVSHFLLNYWWLVLIIIAGIIGFLKYYLATESGKQITSIISLNIPMFRSITRGIYISNFARTLSNLIQGGVPIIKSLIIVSESIGNLVVENDLKKVVMDVERGIPLSDPIGEIKYFPQLVSSMIAVGEQTGQLDKILINIADMYEEDANNLLKGINSLLEPIIMLVVGIAVAFLAVSVILPIYQLSEVSL